VTGSLEAKRVGLSSIGQTLGFGEPQVLSAQTYRFGSGHPPQTHGPGELAGAD